MGAFSKFSCGQCVRYYFPMINENDSNSPLSIINIQKVNVSNKTNYRFRKLSFFKFDVINRWKLIKKWENYIL